jgi:hypothetical protein
MPGLSLFLGWWPLSSTRSADTISGTGYLVAQLFTAGGNMVISKFIEL